MTTHIYHITHINNLHSILNSGGLMANSMLKQDKTEYLDIAYEHIQDRRGMTRVPYGAGGTLHDYVPFYFAPRSPMLYANHKKSVDNYTGGQTPILHLVSSAEAVDTAQLRFVWTDGHAAMSYTKFFDEIGDILYAIDWEIMQAKYWINTEDDGDRKRRRQAEFLVYQFFPWSLIQEIVVINATIEKQVKEILQNFNVSTSVRIYSQWYY